MEEILMKRNTLICLFLALLLCLLSGAAPAENEKAEGEPQGDLDSLFSWYYATGSLPDGASLRETSLRLNALHAKGSGADTAALENITGCSLDFVSGDEALKSAVLLTAEEAEAGHGLSVDIRIDNAALTSPGAAVFRLTLESASYRCVKDCTLRVLSPDEAPSYTLSAEPKRFICRPGSSLSAADVASGLLKESFKAYSTSSGIPCPVYGASVSGSTDPGLSVSPDGSAVSVLDFGVYPLELAYYAANLEWTLPFDVEALSYSITAPSFLLPGSSVRCRITDEDAGVSRRFTWSVSGNGAVIDPQTGWLEISPSAEPGSSLTLTLTPDGDPPLTADITIPAGVLEEMPELRTEMEKGFKVPVPFSKTWEIAISDTREGGWVARCRTLGFDNALIYVDSRVAQITSGFRESPDAALAFYDQLSFSSGLMDLQKQDLEIDGHPARMVTYTMVRDGQAARFGEIHYVRNNFFLTFRIYNTKKDTPADGLIPVSFSDLERFAAEIHYNAASAPIRESDTELTISAKNGKTLLAGGESVQLTASFANPQIVRADGGSDIRWSLVDSATGLAPKNASISSAGQVTVSKALDAPAVLEAVVTSAAYGNTASLRLDVVPAASKVSIDPQDGVLYAGKDPVSFRAVMVPDTIPMERVSWTLTGTAAKLSVAEDGTAVLTPEATGSGMLTAAAPGGRRAELKISVRIPVESVSLSHDREPVPGGTVTFTADVKPKDAANRKVEWSVDVGPDIAAISASGKLTVKKGAPAGTQITVTCTASGAPEPVVVSETLTVIEK